MNPQDLDQIEARLRRLPLRGPSADLHARVAALGMPRARLRPWRRLAVAAASAAALAGCLAAILVWRSHPGDEAAGLPGPAVPAKVEPQPSPPPVHTSQPIHIEQVWTAVSAREVVPRDGAPPVERLERQVVRHIRVIDQDRHVEMEWSIPTKETVVVPLEYN